MTAATERRAGCPPRYGTPRTPDRATLGPRVAAVAEKLGKPLMPHQRQIMDVALEIDPETGYLAYDEVVLVGPRQATGKTEAVLPLMTHRCMGFTRDLTDWIGREYGHRLPPPDPQRVLFLAQTADEARKKWREIHMARLDASRFTRDEFTATLTQNKERFAWRNGSTWLPGSNTAKTAGTGDSVDMGIMDEYWSHKDIRAELGLRPAMMTRPWRQLWKCSMVPGLTRALPADWAPLRSAMTAGRARAEAGVTRGTAYFEFSAEPGLDPGDPATWWSCLPALPRIGERVIQSDYDRFREAGKLIDFEAEYLGWEPRGSSSGWKAVAEESWEAGRDSHSVPMDPVTFGVAMKPDRSSASISMAARCEGGYHGELVDRRPGTDWVVGRVAELIEAWDVAAVGIEAGGPESSEIAGLRAALDNGTMTTPLLVQQIPDVCSGSAKLWDLIHAPADAAEHFCHLGQAELTRAAKAADRYVIGSRWRWDHQAGAQDVSPLRAVSVALRAGMSLDWPGGAYDIASTLG